MTPPSGPRIVYDPLPSVLLTTSFTLLHPGLKGAMIIHNMGLFYVKISRGRHKNYKRAQKIKYWKEKNQKFLQNQVSLLDPQTRVQPSWERPKKPPTNTPLLDTILELGERDPGLKIYQPGELCPWCIETNRRSKVFGHTSNAASVARTRLSRRSICNLTLTALSGIITIGTTTISVFFLSSVLY